MATRLDTTNLGQFQSWNFSKALVQAQNQNRSPESSTSEFSESDDRVRITTTNLQELKRSLVQDQKSPAMLDDRYMSSEEELSPLEHDVETSDEEASIYEARAVSPIKYGGYRLAVAICITQVGKAKVVDVPVPSLTSSPTISSDGSRSSRPASLPTSIHAPVRRKAVPISKSPLISTRLSATSFADLTNFTPTFDAIPLPPPPVQDLRPLEPAATLPAFLNTDPFEKRPKSNHSRLRNISRKLSNFAMYGPGKTAESFEPTAVSNRPATAHKALPPKPKMVPRGADEREPMIEIPPFPDHEFCFVTPEQLSPSIFRRRKSTPGR